MANPFNLGNPNLPSDQPFAGYSGYKSALDAYMSQAAGQESEGAGQLASAQDEDELAGGFGKSNATAGGYGAGGRGMGQSLGAYSQILGGGNIASAAGQNATDLARANALQGVQGTYSNAANSITNIRSAREQQSIANQNQAMQNLQQILSLPQEIGNLGTEITGGPSGFTSGIIGSGNFFSNSISSGGSAPGSGAPGAAATNGANGIWSSSGGGASGALADGATFDTAGETATDLSGEAASGLSSAGSSVGAGASGLWSALMGLF